MRTRRSWFGGLALLASALCVGSGCSSPPPAEPEPAQNLMTREVAAGETSPVVDPAGRFRSALSLPFSAEATEDGDLVLDIAVEGSGVSMYCFILREESALGVSSLRIAESIFDDFESQDLVLSERRTLAIDAGVIGEAAYQSLVVAFDLRDEQGEGGLGTMKTASANKLGHGIACNHWAAGYLSTFARTFAELVENFEPSEPPPANHYVEASHLQVNGLLVGVASMRLLRDTEGDVRTVNESSMLIPRSVDELLAVYNKSIDWSRSDGTLINAYDFEEDVDGEVTSLRLDFEGEETGWQATGTFERKPFSQTLGSADPLASAFSEVLVFRHALRPRGERSEVLLDRWVPAADPASVSQVAIRLDEEDPSSAVMALGPMQMDVQRGEDGLPQRLGMNFGSAQMVLERIYRRGDL